MLIGLLIMIAVYGVLLWLAFRAVWKGATLPRGASRQPACGRCGYSVAGLTTMTCPECGADLRVEGIVTARATLKQRGSATGMVIGLGVLVLVLALFGAGPIASVSAQRYQKSVRQAQRQALEHVHNDTVQLKSVSSDLLVGITEVGVGVDGATRPEQLLIWMQSGSGRSPTMTVNLYDNTYTLGNPSPKQTAPKPYDPESIAVLYEGLGIRRAVGGQPEGHRTLVGFLGEVRRFGLADARRFSTPAGFTETSWIPLETSRYKPFAVPHDLTRIVLLCYSLFAFALWVAGSAWLVRRREKLLTRSERSKPGAATTQ